MLRFVGSIDVANKKCSVKLDKYPKTHPFAGTQYADNIVAFQTGQPRLTFSCSPLPPPPACFTPPPAPLRPAIRAIRRAVIAVFFSVIRARAHTHTHTHMTSPSNSPPCPLPCPLRLPTTERYVPQPLVVQGPGAGAAVTAAGIYADFLRIVDQCPE